MIVGPDGVAQVKPRAQRKPEERYHMASTLEWADTRLPGIFRLAEPLLRLLAKRARRKGIDKELEARYCQGDDERWVHAQRT